MMTTAVDAAFVDTNILIYVHLPASPFHVVAVQKLQGLHQAGTPLWISRQIMREYLAGMTKPGVLTGAIPVASLSADVVSMASHFLIAEENDRVTTNLLTLMSVFSVAGKQVHDANIVATMQAYGITKLLTHNVADFARFASIITVIPLVP